MDDERTGDGGAWRMIDIFSAVQNLCQDAGFKTHLASLNRQSLVCFEDSSFIGFCSLFDDPQQLIDNWYEREDAILTKYAPNFRAAGDKAWNVYCVFLCESEADNVLNRQLRWIEEDLDRTRKIVGCGISSRDGLAQILLPILPLQYQPLLEGQDVAERLRSRMMSISPRAADAVLDDEILPSEVVRLMGEMP